MATYSGGLLGGSLTPEQIALMQQMAQSGQADTWKQAAPTGMNFSETMASLANYKPQGGEDFLKQYGPLAAGGAASMNIPGVEGQTFDGDWSKMAMGAGGAGLPPSNPWEQEWGDTNIANWGNIIYGNDYGKSAINTDGWVTPPTGGKILGSTNGPRGAFAMDSLQAAQALQQKYGGILGKGYGTMNRTPNYDADGGIDLNLNNLGNAQDPGWNYYWKAPKDIGNDALRDIGVYADPSWMDRNGFSLFAALSAGAGLLAGGAAGASSAGAEVGAAGLGSEAAGLTADFLAGAPMSVAQYGSALQSAVAGSPGLASEMAMYAAEAGLPMEAVNAIASGNASPEVWNQLAQSGMEEAGMLTGGSGVTSPLTGAGYDAALQSAVAGSSGLPAEMAAIGAGAGGGGGSVASTAASTLGTAGKLAGALGGGLLGAVGGSSKAGDQTVTTRQEIDPRMASLLYGPNGNDGFLSQLMGQANQQMNPGMKLTGQAAENYLGTFSAMDFERQRDAAGKLMAGNMSAPQMQAAGYNAQGMTPAMMQAAQANVPGNGMYNASQAGAAQINAPGQNDLGLMSAYSNMIYGDPAQNPYLTGAIQKGINQSTNAFNDYLDSSKTAVNDVLGNIRGGAIANGGYGGSRQGIAEGRAVGDFSKGLTQAATRFGQNNTDAAVGAQAGAFDAGQNRALNAMSGLGAQQYGVAGQNAGFNQQTGLANAGFLNNAGQFNAGQGSNLAQFNAGLLQNANQYNATAQNNAGQFNAGANNQAGQFNAGNQQSANTNNMQSQLSTNQLNSQNQLAGMGAMSNLRNDIYGYGTNYDAYGLNRMGKVGGLLQGYTGLGGSRTESQPLYENKTGNILGGITTGIGLMNNFNKLWG